ncbi:hypothetical protein RGQ29_012915 [Quercus rubra]|uniref:non-specific serine/threonine protein kinase n=1 Tax=Quercus rubra TaxID=3512 RepID=A0AAN7G2Q5_QUERU|nr:hypothetical protein RGQ29_012915 [Quercus rubra]
MDISVFVFLSSIFFLFYFVFSHATDNITQSQFLNDSKNTTLVSKEGVFVLGFFSPGDSTNRYLGIWYSNIPIKTVVWVANRRNPIIDSSGVLMVNSSGSLVLLKQNSTVVWFANSTKEAGNSMVQLLDSGNLVLREVHEENPENYLWQSFDYPSDTWLPGMKLGWDLRTGLERRLTAWKSPDDPSPGEMSYGIEHLNYPELVMKNGSEMHFRSGPWNGLGFSGVPEVEANPFFSFRFFSNKDEVYFTFDQHSVISRAVLNQTQYERYMWDNGQWKLYLHFPRDECDNYNKCGVYGNCVIGESAICQCIQGFKPESEIAWIPDEGSKGCVRSTQLSCQDKEKIGFVKFVGYKLPDTTYSWVNQSMNLKECRVKCLNNCSCMAYSNSDIRDGPDGGSGCVVWYGDLIDLKSNVANRQEVYIRMPASEQEFRNIIIFHRSKPNLIVVIFWFLLYNVKTIMFLSDEMENNVMIDQNIEDQSEDLGVPFFSLATIATATNNFSSTNKLGEGGFGLVYKGTLTDGQEIAVKRLSQSSMQGLDQLKNEVTLIAKLQHRNLVRLLGYCIEGHETILIYEYMSNRSLDSFIFDQTRARVLGWSMRFNIICGIARGLLYLHEDSRLRIIHRDLKASNILLDSEMNPKISDFGMARIFGGNQTEGNTDRVVGTHGYMAPEYAIDGLFSVKSDVFSFGI